MIQVNALIEYLRENMTGYTVGGAAEFKAAEDDSRLLLPSLFVTLGPFKTFASPNNENIDQLYEENIFIFSGCDNQADRTGQHSQQLVPSTRQALINLLFGNRDFDVDGHPFQYGGDEYVTMDRARYWHKYVFKLIGRLDYTDQAEVNLDNFNRWVANWNSLEETFPDNPMATDDIIGLYDLEPTN